jgi:hypothetical protein
MLTMPTEDLVKDARERLHRGATTPQDVEDLADAVDELQGQVDDLREKLIDAEAEDDGEIIKFLVMTTRAVAVGGMPLTRERLREATAAFGLGGDEFDQFWAAPDAVQPADGRAVAGAPCPPAAGDLHDPAGG